MVEVRAAPVEGVPEVDGVAVVSRIVGIAGCGGVAATAIVGAGD